MKILITGVAGFIGMHTAERLAAAGHTVVGIDNLNDYYDIQLKLDRLAFLGLSANDGVSSRFKAMSFYLIDIADEPSMKRLFVGEAKFDCVCNLAAQAGVRHSITNPRSYIMSNIEGFFNVLEACRHHSVKHLVYASSSSVYGANTKTPYSVDDKCDSPVSLYAATKKSNELMAHSYSALYGFRSTGLRFFTVYGPWGRPDMAPYLFTEAIANGQPIKVFNNGDMMRDFTYIDDIVSGIVSVIEHKFAMEAPLHSVYNIGNNSPMRLMDFIAIIEDAMGREAEKVFLPMQQGDVMATWADITSAERDFGYRPTTPPEVGIPRFVEWLLPRLSN